MKKYKNNYNGEEISEDVYNELKSSEQSNYSEVEDEDFTTSLLTGMITDNFVVGSLLGGSVTGSIIGDLLSDGELF